MNDTDNRNLVIVMHASVGSGHRSAAHAIAEAFKLVGKDTPNLPTEQNTTGKTPPDNKSFSSENLKVEVLDVLDFGRIVFDGNKTLLLFTGITRPIYDITWRFNLTGHLLWGGGCAWCYLMYDKFASYVAKEQPLAIVCTHITAANVAVAARMITGQHFPIVCVPTDYEVEGLWPHTACDLFCVANKSIAETLRPRRVSDKRILITGIPTHDDFCHTYSRAEVYDTFGLPQNRRVVLVLAGAKLPRPYVHFRAAIERILPYLSTFHEQFHFVLVAGNDKNYAAHLHQACKEFNITNATVLDYVNNMAALMATSDLIICKPGGLAVTECLCAQTPMLLLGRAYGQEKINLRMLTSRGAALHAITPSELLGELQLIAKDPDRTKTVLQAANSLRRPNAARDIADATLRLAFAPKNVNSPLYRKHFLHFYWGGKPAHPR